MSSSIALVFRDLLTMMRCFNSRGGRGNQGRRRTGPRSFELKYGALPLYSERRLWITNNFSNGSPRDLMP